MVDQKVNVATIIAIENSQSKPKKELLDKIAEIFVEQSLRFQPQGGFIVDKNVVTIYEGKDGYLKVLEDILQTCGSTGEEVLFLGSNDRRSSNEVNEMHKKIYEVKISCKYLISNKDNYVLGPLEEYRQVGEEAFFSKYCCCLSISPIFLSRLGIVNKKRYVELSNKTKPTTDKIIIRVFFFIVLKNKDLFKKLFTHSPQSPNSSFIARL